MTAESSVWGADDWDDDLLLTDSYDESQYTASYLIENDDNWAGWHFVTSIGSKYPIYGWGLYKLCRNNTNDYFYLDFRDDRYGGYDLIGGYAGHWIDLWIKYDASTGRFYYSNDGNGNWIQLTSDGSPHPILSIWEIKEMGDPSRDRFQPTTPTNLALSYSNGNPVLNWDLSEPESAAYYKIYREISSSPGWNCIDSTGAGISTYNDNSFSIGNAYARYCIVAVSGNGKINSPDSSNQVQTSVKPTTPSNLTVTWSNNRPLLTWRCSEPRAAATYEVWRKVKGGFKYLQTIEDWCCIHYGQAGDTTYSDNGFSSGSGYAAYYKIRAVSGDGNLYSPDWSNTVSVTGNFTPNAKDKKFRAVEIDPIPTEFCLHPVYPNPFNITTTLKLDLPEETRFSLGIYDIKGCEVWRLNNRQTNTYPAGYHSIVWDGRDNSGAVVPTGVYFIVYHSAEHRLSQKVVLMK